MNTIEGILNASMGQYGGLIINDTDNYTPLPPYNFIGFIALEDSVITATGSISNFNSITIKEGMSIPGVFTNLQLSSGSIIAFYGG